MRDPGARQVQGHDNGWLERHPERVLAGLALILCTLIGPWWYATPDAAAYLSIARRLAHGAAPHAFGSPQPSYPLGYPLLISPAYWVDARPFLLFSAIHWLLAVGFMLGVYRWLRRTTPDAAVLLTCLVMANINVWNMYRRTLSEVAFLPLLVWSVNMANDVLDVDRRGGAGIRLVGLGGFLFLLIATRELGLLAAVAVFRGSEESPHPSLFTPDRL